MRLIKYKDREKAKQIVKQYQYTFPEKLINGLNEVSVKIQKENLDYKSIYGVLDKVYKEIGRNKTYDFIQGIIIRIQPLYKNLYNNESVICLGDFVFFDTYINNDEFRGYPTGYYKIDELILMEGGY